MKKPINKFTTQQDLQIFRQKIQDLILKKPAKAVTILTTWISRKAKSTSTKKAA